MAFLPGDKEEQKGDGSKNFRQELKTGLLYVRNRLALRTLGGTFAVSGLAVGLTQPLMLFVAMENLDQDKSFLRWLLTSYGAAMFVGGGLIMAVSKKIKPHVLLAAGLTVSTFGTVGLGLSTSIPLTLVLQMLNGLCFQCIHIGVNTLILRNTEKAFVGRVGGVLTPLFMGMMVVGMAVMGSMKAVLGLSGIFGVSGVLFLAGALILAPLFRKAEPAAAAEAS